MIPLIEKYRVAKFSEIIGQDIAIQELKNFYKTFPMRKAVILNGPAGTGKTSLAIALANEYDLELFELNASDLRNKSSLEAVLKPSLEQRSIVKKSKLILMDEADGITTSDRGGLPELIALISKTNYPIIITTNDVWQRKFSLLRQKCKIINVKELKENDIKKILIKVLHKENKKIQFETIDLISKQARGDVRSSLNDLQSIIDVGEEEYISEISEREKQDSIFNALKKLFQSSSYEKIITLFDNLELQLDEISLWIEENIPEEYKGIELVRAFDALSKADIFKGRIYRQQHWRFLVYQNFFLTAGISSVNKNKNIRFISYKRPSRILKIWLSNQKNQKKKSITNKYARYCHMSIKKANKESYLLPFLITNLDSKIMKNMDLDEKDIEYIEERKDALIAVHGLKRFE